MTAKHNQPNENRQRLMEIVEVLRRHELSHGITPDKLCAIIEELGPTYIKLGQILSMHSDVFPEEYCEALKRLHSNVAPMPYEQVVSIIENAYGCPLEDVFQQFDEVALGSASIAQAHAATLRTGERVVVKVQREGIHETMSRDILLLKRACGILKYTPANDLIDLNQVLDEMWVVAQEELNFQTEARNLERFHELNQDVAYVASPTLYRDYTTTQVLVMEHIDGVAIDKKDKLAELGYDLSEIGAKLADNYVKQIMDDGFFHADPHPGNLRVRDGKIVWLDMGMMGSLTEQQKRMVTLAITGIARNDVNVCRDAVMGLGEFHEQPDRRRLFRDIEAMLDRYASASLGDMNLTAVFEDLTNVMQENHIGMPGSLTMLARGLATIEGVVADLSPELNVMNVVTARMGKRMLQDIDLRSTLRQDVTALYDSAHKSLEIPALVADILHTGLKGEANLGIEHHAGDDMRALVREVTDKACGTALTAALLVCGGLLQGAIPVVGGVSWWSIACFVAALAPMGWAFWRYRKKH